MGDQREWKLVGIELQVPEQSHIGLRQVLSAAEEIAAVRKEASGLNRLEWRLFHGSLVLYGAYLSPREYTEMPLVRVYPCYPRGRGNGI